MRVDFGIELKRLFFRLGEHFYKLASSIEEHSYMLWDSATVAEPIIFGHAASIFMVMTTMKFVFCNYFCN